MYKWLGYGGLILVLDCLEYVKMYGTTFMDDTFFLMHFP